MTTSILIGFGSIGRRHAKVLERTGHDMAIVDYSEEVRQRAKQTYQDAHVVAEVGELSEAGIDFENSAGIIATWAPTHAEYFHKLSDLGVKRILCEKPLTNSLEAAESMCERAEEDDIRLVVDHKFRYSGGLDAIRSWEEEYDLGEPVHFVSNAGAVGLINKGVHIVDLAFGIFNSRPSSVVSTASSNPLNPRSDELGYYGGTSVWQFDDDCEAVLSYTNGSSVTQDLRIYYRDAILTIDDDYNVEIKHRDGDELEEYPEITRHGLASETLYSASNPFVDSKLDELENAQADLLSDNPPASPGRLGRDVTEACIGSLVATTERESVSLPISESHEYWDYNWQYN